MSDRITENSPMTMKIRASELKIGDVIMPPPREVSLWMRRTCKEKNLPETALYQTIVEIKEGTPDVRGSWLLITCDQTPEWCADYVNGPAPFTFKVRPQTPWITIKRAA